MQKSNASKQGSKKGQSVTQRSTWNMSITKSTVIAAMHTKLVGVLRTSITRLRRRKPSVLPSHLLAISHLIATKQK